MNDQFWILIGTGSATLSGLAFISASLYYKRQTEKSAEYLRQGFLPLSSIALSRFGLAWMLLLSPLISGLALTSRSPLACMAPVGIAIGATWGASRAWQVPGTTRRQLSFVSLSLLLVLAMSTLVLLSMFHLCVSPAGQLLEFFAILSLLIGLLSVPLSLEWLERRGSFMCPIRDMTSEMTFMKAKIQGEWNRVKENYNKSLGLLAQFSSIEGAETAQREALYAANRLEDLKSRIQTLKTLTSILSQTTARKRILSQPDLDLVFRESVSLPSDLGEFSASLEKFILRYSNLTKDER